jgi:hypothetical protein
MGKTSILHNLEALLDGKGLVVHLDLQRLTWSERPNEMVFEIVLHIHRRAQKAGLDLGPEPQRPDLVDLGTAKRALEAQLERLDGLLQGRRLVLTFDEFEIFEREIREGRLDVRFLEFLRSCYQQYSWLALIFAGLHSLEEMNQDYFGPFYSSHEPVKVGYLARDDAFRLLAEPDEDFDLELEAELLAEIFRLTYGQPYLLQRLAWELVEKWNERFHQSIEPIPRILRAGDLEPVIDRDFYAAADYYFDGLWQANVTAAERQLMAVLAMREGPWQLAEIQGARQELGVERILTELEGHDILLRDEGGRYRFAAELLRRWVVREKEGEEERGGS